MKSKIFTICVFVVAFGSFDLPLSWGQTYPVVKKWEVQGKANRMAFSPNGLVYATNLYDVGVEKYTSNGDYLGIIGAGSGSYFSGIAVDLSGNIFAIDYANYRIQKFDKEGNYLMQWGSNGPADGQFNDPSDIEVDANGNVYVSDATMGCIQKFSNDGYFLAKWRDPLLRGPSKMTMLKSGSLYAIDNGSIVKFDENGNLVTAWDNINMMASLVDIASDEHDNIFVMESYSLPPFNKAVTKRDSSCTLLKSSSFPTSTTNFGIDQDGYQYLNLGGDSIQKRIELFTYSSTGLDGPLPESNFHLKISYNVVFYGNFSGPPYTPLKSLEVDSGVTFSISDRRIVAREFRNHGNVVLVQRGGLLATDSSSGNIEVRLEAASSNSGVYNYLSSPFQSLNVNTFRGSHNKYQFTPVSNSWAEATGAMTPGKGYAMSGIGPVSFSGRPTIGAVSIPITYQGNGFNLLGNPYPIDIDYNQLFSINTPNIWGTTGTIWFWDQAANSTYGSGDYAVYNAVGGVAGGGGHIPNGTISKCQGFFVQAMKDIDFTFLPSMHETVPTDTAHFFRLEEEEKQRIRLNLTAPNQDFNQTLVAFLPSATDGLDATLDAPKFKGNSQFSFASLLADKPYTIQALAPLAGSKTIGLVVDAGINGPYTFSTDTIENIPAQYGIYLEDKQTGEITDLRATQRYTAQVETGTNQQRFSLHLVNTVSTHIDAVLEEQVPLYAYVKEDGVHLHHSLPIDQVALFQANGQLALTQQASSQNHTILPVTGLRKGLYVLRVSSGGKTTTQKIVLD